MTGGWFGRYAYPSGQPPVPFWLIAEETAGALDGRTTEQPDGLEPLGAAIEGTRTGARFGFVKTYDDPDFPPIAYEGQLSAEGEEARGTWRVGALQGTFTLTRRHADDEDDAVETGREVTAGG